MPIAMYVLLALILLGVDGAFAGQSAPPPQAAVTSNSAPIVKIHKRRNSFAVDYVLQRQGHSPAKKKAVVKVPPEIAQSQFFDATATWLFNDALPAIEVTGNCGNKVCEKLIFRFDESRMEYQLFFRGAYSSVSIFNGYLIEAGSSGCCAFEYHAYKIPEADHVISGSPQMVIVVTNNSVSTSENSIECAFTDAAGESIDIPNRDWLKFCEVYGESYQVKR
jgi:hypothetical protein